MTHGPVSAFTWAAPGWALASLAWGAAFRSRRQLPEPAPLRTELAEARDRAQLVVLAYESRLIQPGSLVTSLPSDHTGTFAAVASRAWMSFKAAQPGWEMFV